MKGADYAFSRPIHYALSYPLFKIVYLDLGLST